MTTLSKEDVVQALEALESMDDFARMDIGVYPIGPYRVLREFIAARADIVDANKALVVENEQLKSYFSEERGKLLGTANTIDRLTDQLINQLTATRTALAAAEADNERLREDFKCAANYVDFMGGDSKNYRQSITQPCDDSALRRLLAEAKAGVYEECAKVCENSDRYRGDYFAAKIRELTEKAKEEKC